MKYRRNTINRHHEARMQNKHTKKEEEKKKKKKKKKTPRQRKRKGRENEKEKEKEKVKKYRKRSHYKTVAAVIVSMNKRASNYALLHPRTASLQIL